MRLSVKVAMLAGALTSVSLNASTPTIRASGRSVQVTFSRATLKADPKELVTSFADGLKTLAQIKQVSSYQNEKKETEQKSEYQSTVGPSTPTLVKTALGKSYIFVVPRVEKVAAFALEAREQHTTNYCGANICSLSSTVEIVGPEKTYEDHVDLNLNPKEFKDSFLLNVSYFQTGSATVQNTQLTLTFTLLNETFMSTLYTYLVKNLSFKLENNLTETNVLKVVGLALQKIGKEMVKL